MRGTIVGQFRQEWYSLVVALVLSATIVGCFRSVDVSEITCTNDTNCPSDYVCVRPGVPGGCELRSAVQDASSVDSSAMTDAPGPVETGLPTDRSTTSQASQDTNSDAPGTGLDSGGFDAPDVPGFGTDAATDSPLPPSDSPAAAIGGQGGGFGTVSTGGTGGFTVPTGGSEGGIAGGDAPIAAGGSGGVPVTESRTGGITGAGGVTGTGGVGTSGIVQTGGVTAAGGIGDGTGGVSGTGGVGTGGIVQTGGVTGVGGGGAGGGSGGCSAMLTLCDGTCVDLRTSMSHCGACGHDCLGGTCSGAVCAPVMLTPAGTAASAMALDRDGGGVFFSHGPRVGRCPLPEGCVLPPTHPVQFNKSVTEVAVSSGTLFWLSKGQVSSDSDPTIYACPTAGCPPALKIVDHSPVTITHLYAVGTSVFWSSAPFSIRHCIAPNCTVETSYPHQGTVPVWAADETDLFFCDTGMLYRCPVPGTCTTPTEFLEVGMVGTIAVFGSQVFWTHKSANVGQIKSCSKAGCTSGTLVASDGNIPDLDLLGADADGFYWAARGELRTCPLTGCVGAPRVLASAPSYPHHLATDEKAVYWIAGASEAAPTGDVLRIAK